MVAWIPDSWVANQTAGSTGTYGQTERTPRRRRTTKSTSAAARDHPPPPRDRVVIIIDEPDGSAWQRAHPAAHLPHQTPSSIWNVASAVRESSAEHSDGTRRYVFSGLADATFDVIPLIEAAHHNAWPF